MTEFRFDQKYSRGLGTSEARAMRWYAHINRRCKLRVEPLERNGFIEALRKSYYRISLQRQFSTANYRQEKTTDGETETNPDPTANTNLDNRMKQLISDHLAYQIKFTCSIWYKNTKHHQGEWDTSIFSYAKLDSQDLEKHIGYAHGNAFQPNCFSNVTWGLSCGMTDFMKDSREIIQLKPSTGGQWPHGSKVRLQTWSNGWIPVDDRSEVKRHTPKRRSYTKPAAAYKCIFRGTKMISRAKSTDSKFSERYTNTPKPYAEELNLFLKCTLMKEKRQQMRKKLIVLIRFSSQFFMNSECQMKIYEKKIVRIEKSPFLKKGYKDCPYSTKHGEGKRTRCTENLPLKKLATSMSKSLELVFNAIGNRHELPMYCKFGSITPLFIWRKAVRSKL